MPTLLRGRHRPYAEETIKKILVIDDDTHLVPLIQIFLEREGFETLSAANGAEGLACAIAEEPSLIVLDVMMPEMDGFETLKRLKDEEATAQIPVIMLTAKTQDADVLNGWQLGVHLYLTKPLDLLVLVKHVKSIFQSHSVEDTYRIYTN